MAISFVRVVVPGIERAVEVPKSSCKIITTVVSVEMCMTVLKLLPNLKWAGGGPAGIRDRG